jgi:hypothetical protein
MVQLEEFQGHDFLFPLEQELPNDCILRLYICKGLESNFVGQFQFRRSALGESLTSTHRSDDCLFEVKIRQRYEMARKERLTFNLK